MTENPTHPVFYLIRDIFDLFMKVVAVVIGACWTWWNYRKSRTYEQKLELELAGSVLIKNDLYGDVRLVVKNIGETKHAVQHKGTFCEVLIVYDDLSELSTDLFRVFKDNRSIEPGEAINDTLCWRISKPLDRILWIKLQLRVVSGGVEWWSTRLVRVEGGQANPTQEVI